MHAAFKIAAMCTLMTGLALPAAAAPVYKWVDENGKVNYGSAPPPGVRAAQALDASAARVSSYDPAQAGLDADSQLRRNGSYLGERAEQLQDQLVRLNTARHRAAEAAAQAKQKRREECERQHRVDCDLDQEYYGGYPRLAVVYRPMFLPYAAGFFPAAAARPGASAGARRASYRGR
jgi:hypothetical protein